MKSRRLDGLRLCAACHAWGTDLIAPTDVELVIPPPGKPATIQLPRAVDAVGTPAGCCPAKSQQMRVMDTSGRFHGDQGNGFLRKRRRRKPKHPRYQARLRLLSFLDKMKNPTLSFSGPKGSWID